MPQVMGFGDERLRDPWLAKFARAGGMRDVGGKLIRPAAVPPAGAREWLGGGWVGWWEGLVGGFGAVRWGCRGIGGGGLGEIERVWAWLEGGREEPAGRYRGPRHVNCRCADRSPLPVERVDPVRAGRTRWWTRK